LITRGQPRPDGKILIIAGGIANFTNVASTFKGIIWAITEFKAGLITHNVQIFVRRGGPHYQEALKAMRLLGESLDVPIAVYGPDTHITEIVPLALGLRRDQDMPKSFPVTAPGRKSSTPLPLNAKIIERGTSVGDIRNQVQYVVRFNITDKRVPSPAYRPFDANTRSFVYGLQPRAIQGMFDFDYSCGREKPSVSAMIYPFGGHHLQKFCWGTKETLLPVYTSISEAVAKHPDVDVVVNFASSRSVYSSTLECLAYSDQIRAVALIAEGVPERHARDLLWRATQKNVLVIGPATIGGIKPGCFRIGNSGGQVHYFGDSDL
jgi:ATP citrate (pro-S)-lyase